MATEAPQSLPDLPTGTLTFLFTDIEGSTRMLQRLGNAYAPLLTRHRALLETAATAHGGRLFGTEGDAVFVAFTDAPSALAAAVDAQRALAAYPWPDGNQIKVRIGIHSGEVQRIADDYVGLALHQTARIMSAGHGGQILVSATTRGLASHALPPDVQLLDLGLHRLKDLAEPERIFQVDDAQLPGTFPALKTLEARPNNLPVQLTTFVAREELESARKLLGSTHLLTLTGPGGTGKTRLALQLAAEVSDDFTDGVFFVPLDAVTDPERVASAIVAAVGLEAGNQPPIERLIAWGRNLKVLLVLDNFEQVVEGAAIVARLLREMPDLRVVVTSRIPLHAYGEQELPVPPLGVPGVDQSDLRHVARSEAARLFAERAAAVQPSFRLTEENAADVAEIVRRLDGLPLAIELAAARVRLLPIPAIRSRLSERLTLLVGGPRDRPSRQQTLRGAIDWSYDLLDEPDRRLLERFGVFAGGGTLSATEAICGPASALGRDILEGVESLLDKSLVRSLAVTTDEPRFAMLATIREYALERLAASSDDTDIHRRHALHFCATAEAARDHLTGSTSRHWLDLLEQEHDNLRAAIDWAIANADAEIALRMGASLWRFWQIRGHLSEARDRLNRILAMPGLEAALPALRSRAEGAAGSVAYWRADVRETSQHYGAALELARAASDRRLLAESLYNFGFGADPDAEFWGSISSLGRPYMQEALAIYRELDDVHGQASVLWGLATPLIVERDYDAANATLREALALYRKEGDSFGIGWSLHMLGMVSVTQERPADAAVELAEAMRVFRETADRSAVVLLLADFCCLAFRTGDALRRLKLAGAVDALRRETGADLVLNQLPGLDWSLPTESPRGGPEKVAWEEGAHLSFDDAVAYSLESAPST